MSLRIIRLFSLIFMAIWTQMLHGPGLAAVIVSGLMGWRYWPFYSLVIPIASFTMLAHYLLGNQMGADKITDALANDVFLTGIYAILCCLGWLAGVIFRQRRL